MQFLMALALRMGRTLSELRQTMSVSELMLWDEYDRISPIGDIRDDIRAAQMVSAVYGSQGGKVSIQDALLTWQQPEADDSADPWAGLEDAFKKAAG
ncbi:DUF4035 domain-containing protein [Leminorella grimontii]|uniref:DUF4035 domain-containing protein n=1 Tax=Leminorella grimontii TaxID=82981 RepID=UPI0020805173|nr:DUF4035 domain-containing protein [Leminorella grimontii]GKX58343.1 phage tail protein [Leminorella grimontii]